jgi:hypothetical protein
MLDVVLDEQYVTGLLNGHTQAVAYRKRFKEQCAQKDCADELEQDFYFIAGYTNGGVPYGGYLGRGRGLLK